MNKIWYFIRFVWYYKKLFTVTVNYKHFRINEILQQGSNKKKYKIYWKHKNKYWIK